MDKTELLEIIRNGENSRVEFKRDDAHPDSLAKEIAALLNLEGGFILLGVEEDARISGLTRSREEAERWVMDVARQNLQREVIPVWGSVAMDDGKIVGVIELPPDSPGKPYKARRGGAWITYLRVGSTSREATREEEGRLYQSARLVRYDIKPVPDTGFESLDIQRIENFFRDILKREVPDRADIEGWERLLLNTDLLALSSGLSRVSVAGLLLFGENPNRRLPQAGVTAAAFPGNEKDYNTSDEERLRGPLVSVF